MGKRVSVKREKAPQLNVNKLKQGSEGTLLLAGFFVPLGLLILVAVLLALSDKTRNFTFTLLGWLLLGWFALLSIANGQKAALLKHFPRSKVGGTAYQDLRLHISQMCRLLEIPRPPDTYVIDSPEVAARVRGMSAPYLVLSNKCLDILTERELQAMLAVLLGHVKAGTVRWRTFVNVALEANPLIKIIALPYVLMASMMKGYLELSHITAERIALLLIDGDYRLLTSTLIKVAAPDQAVQLQGFLSKQGMEARAEDVEQAYILNQMIRQTPGMQERIENITRTPSTDKFIEQLAIMKERIERFQIR